MAVQIAPEEVQPIQKIGDGAFSEVYKAMCKGTIVAVKKWRNLTPSEKEVQDLLREIEIGGKYCNHPNLTRVYAFCPNPIMLVLEYFESRELYDVIRDRTVRYPWAVVRHVGLQLALALQHLHRCNIIHRDVKSPNILVSPSWQIKLCDYGQSRVKDFELRHTGRRGTVLWSAPEVLRVEPYDQTSDVYSYGVVIWELLMRDQPYAHVGDNPVTVALHICRGATPLLPPSLPSALRTMLEACFSRRCECRPTADQLVAFWNDPACIPPELLNAPL